MKTLKVTFTRKVKYQIDFQISDDEFEIIKDLDNDDVSMYDPKTIKVYENGQKTIQLNPQYEILQDLDTEKHEIEREETLFDVSVELIK